MVFYSGSFSIDLAAGAQTRIAPPARTESGKMLLDSRGEATEYDGTLQPPLAPDPLGRMGIETLASGSQSTWTVRRSVGIARRLDVPRASGIPEFGYRGRYGSGPPGLPLPGGQALVWVPATVEIRYTIEREGTDGTVTIRKEYDLTTTDDDADPLLAIHGTGTVIWDRAKGVPRSSAFQADYRSNATGTPVNLPINIECAFTVEDSPRGVAGSGMAGSGVAVTTPASTAAAPPAAAAPPKPAASPSVAITPPAPLTPGAPPSKRSSLTNFAPSAGLDRFRPD